jgi:hypothetical protein
MQKGHAHPRTHARAWREGGRISAVVFSLTSPIPPTGASRRKGEKACNNNIARRLFVNIAITTKEASNQGLYLEGFVKCDGGEGHDDE